MIMRALCWHGKGDVRIDTVPDPKIQHPRDAIIKITACAICGSDLHLLDGYQPTIESGDILGHENMGEVIELGSEVTNLDNWVVVRCSSRTFFRRLHGRRQRADRAGRHGRDLGLWSGGLVRHPLRAHAGSRSSDRD